MHVAWIPQRSGCRRHYGADELIRLLERRFLNVQRIGSDARQGAVVEHHDCVCVLSKPAEGKKGVVGLNDDISSVLCVREDGVGLNELFREAVVKSFKQERA